MYHIIAPKPDTFATNKNLAGVAKDLIVGDRKGRWDWYIERRFTCEEETALLDAGVEWWQHTL